MSEFTTNQMKACKAIVNLFETGDFIGKYDTVVVLDDHAGITYGRTQTTENSGGLWTLIFDTYAELNGKFMSEFEPYKDLLYKEGDSADKKDDMADNEGFKALLKTAARQDELMRKAQDQFFHKKYFRPALKCAAEYEITKPLILAAMYDLSIHSGPDGMNKHVDDFNEAWDVPAELEDASEEEIELRWGKDLMKYRRNWLANFKGRSAGHTKAVRNTVYRIDSLLDLAAREEWNLGTPLRVKLVSKYHSLTEDMLNNVW